MEKWAFFILIIKMCTEKPIIEGGRTRNDAFYNNGLMDTQQKPSNSKYKHHRFNPKVNA